MGFCNGSLVLLCVTLCPFLFYNHLDGNERACCFIFLVSRYCCVSLPRDATVCLQFVIVVFPEHIQYFC